MPDAMPGHNRPPNDVQLLRDRLSEKHADLSERQRDLLDAVKRLPAEITDEEMAGDFADFSKQIAGAIKRSDAALAIEREPHDELLAACRGFFKRISEPLAEQQKEVKRRLKLYQQAVERAEREAREQAAKEARAAAAKAKAEADAELKRAEQAEAEAREKAEAEAATQHEADAALEKAVKADRAATDARNLAASKKAAAEVKSAELTRNRGELGSVASLRDDWIFEIEDLKSIDLETLRPHIPLTAIQQAIRAHIKVGGRKLAGVRIYKDHSSVVR